MPIEEMAASISAIFFRRSSARWARDSCDADSELLMPVASKAAVFLFERFMWVTRDEKRKIEFSHYR